MCICNIERERGREKKQRPWSNGWQLNHVKIDGIGMLDVNDF